MTKDVLRYTLWNSVDFPWTRYKKLLTVILVFLGMII